jgi:hypothetical protein
MSIEFGDTTPVEVPGVGAVIGGEFAAVSVTFDTSGNAPRLRLHDLRTGRVRHLDALELETIIWLPDDKLAGLLDPSHSRWSGEAAESHDAGPRP